MNWLIVDLETTGFHSKKDHIIEIGAVRIDARGKRTTFQTLVDPGVLLTEGITELTGITDEMLEGQPGIEEVIPDFLDFMGDARLIAHNSSFDGGFLEPYIGINKDEWLDTITLSRMAFPMLSSYRLAYLVEYFNIEVSAHHRALADAEATAELFDLIEKSFAQTDKGMIAAFLHLLGKKYSVYKQYFERFEPALLDEKYMPPKAPRQNEEETDDAKAAEKEYAEKYVINKETLADCFRSEDGLKRYVSGFCQRDSQTEMAFAVADAFNNEDFLLAEAGTGTGKTIAYLLPSIYLSLYGGERVIISTHTIHLQDQLMRKDIPELNRYFDGNIRSALIKGRGHYLCYRKWEVEYDNDDSENAMFMARLLPWVCETEDGDGDVLNLNSFEKNEWRQFSASSENCLGFRCPYFRNRCFVRRARRHGETANLIVINHSLLLTDSVMSGGILPYSNYLIIDEAHQLETVAESCLGHSFSYYDHVTAVSELQGVAQKMNQRISFPSLYATDSSLETIREKQAFLEELLENIKNNGEKAKECFSALKEVLEVYQSRRNLSSRTWRIDHAVRSADWWNEAGTSLENISLWYEEIRKLLTKFTSLFETEWEEDGYENDRIRFTVAKEEWLENGAALAAFIGGEEKNNVAWLEDNGERRIYPTLKTAPVKIDQALAEALYNVKDSIVFVSATLSVKNNFQYFRDICGLDLAEHETKELLLPSPFDYKYHAVMVAANDIPLVGTVSEYEYLNAVADAIISMTAASNGRALVLFTSHMHLREVFRRVEKPLKVKGVNVLAHEISGSRSLLLKKMREDGNTVILGANSFWEGIDVAGENLSLLIIVRLPFWPPDIPTIAAKLDRLKADHRNAFAELSLPQAVIRFKQGFGRLLRKEDDRGIICVLDKRIYEKRYGNDFVDSLPVERLYPLSVKEITELIETKL